MTHTGMVEQMISEELIAKINAICTAAHEPPSVHELLELSLSNTLAIFQARRGSIFLLSPNGKELSLQAVRGMALSEQKQMVKKLGEGIVGRVAHLKTPLLVDDISQDERFRNFKSRKSYRSPSFICSPLMIKDKLIGVINIADKESGERFSKEELQLLDFLSNQIAINHQRVLLAETLQTIVQESEALKAQLGKTSQEATHLRRQIILNERLASLGKLAGGIAHEFNNPLDGVMRYTNLCLEHTPEDDVTREYLLEIKHGLKRMANIVKSLLDCARNTPPTMQRVDVGRVIDEVVSSLDQLLIKKHITIHKQVARDIPEIMDLGLEQVIKNLVRNGIDAIDQKGKISITASCANDCLKIEIQDTGHGIPREDIEKIFEPFYTTKDMEHNFGLGLTIISEIIKQYPGKIEVESTLGRGTTFIITLPIDGKTT